MRTPIKIFTYDPSLVAFSDVMDDYVVSPKVLGEGQYGCVRECIHRVTWKTYACKSIDKSKILRLDHLQNEVHLLSEMNHHGIMKMVDCYEDADYVHIVTERYTGGELFDKIIDNTTDDGCYSEHKAACIVKSLLEAVAIFMRTISYIVTSSQRTAYLDRKMKSSLLTLASHEDTRKVRLP